MNGCARINTWLDSMRASSPTHIKSSSPSLSDYSWMVRRTRKHQANRYIGSVRFVVCGLITNGKFVENLQAHHPSALDMLDEIRSASKGKQIVMFLDYDGTLSPIVDDPDRAFMSHAVSICIHTHTHTNKCFCDVSQLVNLCVQFTCR